MALSPVTPRNTTAKAHGRHTPTSWGGEPDHGSKALFLMFLGGVLSPLLLGIIRGRCRDGRASALSPRARTADTGEDTGGPHPQAREGNPTTEPTRLKSEHYFDLCIRVLWEDVLVPYFGFIIGKVHPFVKEFWHRVLDELGLPSRLVWAQPASRPW